MSECTGPGCPHPEHTDPATMPAWQHQRLPTHAGDQRVAEAAAEEDRRHDRQVSVIRELFGRGDPFEPPMTLRRGELAALRERTLRRRV